MLRLEEHDAEDAHQGDDDGQHREEPDDGRDAPLAGVMGIDLLVEEPEIGNLAVGIEFAGLLPDSLTDSIEVEPAARRT